ncbi:hypothetical protein ACIO93_36255 [Streptomyces sp. NPDC087903]|uniref:hypothetical protein n=1 Tax=Streptomyces sp. NPDC087903 TaxID=3365819 RepID=UPI00380202B9
MKMRIFRTCSFFILLTLFAAESGTHSSPVQPAESGANAKHDLASADQGDLEGISLILLDIERSKSRRGWNTLAVKLGIRNNSDAPKRLAQIADLAGKIHVAEGSPVYGVRLHSASFPALTGVHDTIIPPKMAICGVLNGSAEVVSPTAVGDIPATLHPTNLEFADLPKVNLESKPSRAQCTPTLPPRTPTAPAKIELGRPDDPHIANIAVSGFRPFPNDYITRLEGRIGNADPFGDLAVEPLDMWMIDRDGVARFSNPKGPYWDSSRCNLGIENEQVMVPPALDSNVWACYPYRAPPAGHPTVAVIQYADNDNPIIVRLVDPL